MAKFKSSVIDFGYKGEQYTLNVNARVAVDLECALGTHPLNLAKRIATSVSNNEVPPMGKMAEFFEFMLKRAGCATVDFDEVYGELFGGGYSEEIGVAIGEMIMLFTAGDDEVDTAKKPKKSKK